MPLWRANSRSGTIVQRWGGRGAGGRPVLRGDWPAARAAPAAEPNRGRVTGRDGG